jgi:hypothetical protein
MASAGYAYADAYVYPALFIRADLHSLYGFMLMCYSSTSLVKGRPFCFVFQASPASS